MFPHFLPLPASGTHLLIPGSTITPLSSVCASASLIASLALGFGATQIVQDGLEPCILITPAKTFVQEGYVGRLWGSAHGHAFRGSSFRLLQTLPGLLASGPRLPGLAGLTRAWSRWPPAWSWPIVLSQPDGTRRQPLLGSLRRAGG